MVQGSNVLGGPPEDTVFALGGARPKIGVLGGVPPRNVLGGSDGAAAAGEVFSMICIDFPLGNSISAP